MYPVSGMVAVLIVKNLTALLKRLLRRAILLAHNDEE